MKLSIVATLYQSSPYIVEFHQRISEVAKALVSEDYELIFVNDGSPDNSLNIAIELTSKDQHLKVVDLSRNFGHHKAMMTGLAHTNGEIVFLIDIDLEEEPELLLGFTEMMSKEKCDVVYGIQKKRKGGRLERISGQWFWTLFNLLSGMNIPKNIATARLMTRRYVKSLLCHKEREVFMAGLWFITGFTQLPYSIDKRSKGNTTYTLRRKMSLLVNSVTSFSNAPLIIIFYLGLAISFAATIYCSFVIFSWIFASTPLISGWTSVIASIWLLGGLIMSSIGVVGIYLSKVYSETKKRPYTIIRKIYGR